jgi:hypothetical protein
VSFLKYLDVHTIALRLSVSNQYYHAWFPHSVQQREACTICRDYTSKEGKENRKVRGIRPKLVIGYLRAEKSDMGPFIDKDGVTVRTAHRIEFSAFPCISCNLPQVNCTFGRDRTTWATTHKPRLTQLQLPNPAPEEQRLIFLKNL